MNAIYLSDLPPPLPPGHKIARKAIQTKVKIVFVCAGSLVSACVTCQYTK